MVMLAEDGFRNAAVPSSGPVLKDLLESPANRFAATPEAKGLIENALAGNYTGRGSFGLNEDGTTGVPEGSDWGSDVDEDELLKLLGGGDIQANTGGSAYDKLDKEYQDKINAPGSSIDDVEADKIREILRNNEDKFKASDFNETLIANADTGAAPIGAYKGGDEKIAVGPYQPDDQAGRMWENFLQQSGGKTPFNYEINLGDKGLESIGADATITGDKGGQWSAQGSYDFPTNQEVMGPFGGETINIPGSISGGIQYTDPNNKWTGSINYNKRNMGMPPGAFGAEFGAQF